MKLIKLNLMEKENNWKNNRTFKRFIHCLKENHVEKIFLDKTKYETFEDFFDDEIEIQHFVDYSFTWGPEGMKWSYIHYQWSYICAMIEKNINVSLYSLINKTYVGAKENLKNDIYANFFRRMANKLLDEKYNEN